MNLDETKKCLALIQEVFPHFMDGRTMKATSDIWVRLFDEPYKTVEAAILAYISSENKGFAPSPGQIKEKIAQMQDTTPDEMQAWEIVKRALRQANRPCHTYEEEYAKLPLLIQQCIGTAYTFREWGYQDEDVLDVTTANAFMRTYRVRAQKQREYGKMPDFAKGAYHIEEQKPYALPQPRAVDEDTGEPTAIPEAAMQKISVFKALAQREELKRAAQMSKRVDGLITTLDSLKGETP